MRLSRWSHSGVLERMFAELQREQIVRIKPEAISLDSTYVKVHPDGWGGSIKKAATICRQVPGRLEKQNSSGCRKCPNSHSIFVVCWKQGRRARETDAAQTHRMRIHKLQLLMDRACEGNETSQ
jgi:hypothetical protein